MYIGFATGHAVTAFLSAIHKHTLLMAFTWVSAVALPDS